MEKSENFKDESKNKADSTTDILLFFSGRRYFLPHDIFDDLITQKLKSFAFCDENNKSVILFSFDPRTFIFRINPLMRNENEIEMPIKHLIAIKDKSSVPISARLISEINEFFRNHSYVHADYHIIREYPRIPPDPSRVRRFLGTSGEYHPKELEGYDLTSYHDSESESDWLKNGFCDKSSEEAIREKNAKDQY